MLGSSSFLEGAEEEEEEGEEATAESRGRRGRSEHSWDKEGKRMSRSRSRSGRGCQEGDAGPGEAGMLQECEKGAAERGRNDVDMNEGHDSGGGYDRTDSSTNHSSKSSACLTSGKRSVSQGGGFTCSHHNGHTGPITHDTENDGSEQQEQGRKETHREMMQAMQEMKKRLPSEKRGHNKARTVEALNYALSCVKQVQANSEYHRLLMRSGMEAREDATVCSLEELESVTSEHTLKNTGMFVVVFSLTSGRIVYVSEQAPSILSCRRSFLDSVRFVELLHHQDANVFYCHTAQPHLPPWSMGSNRAAVLYECTLVKSFFCRIRGGKDREGLMRYNPFRITPYLLKVQGVDGEQGQPCCLALAERIHSGYEAPRIPLDKRIFTTTHSPGCIFMEVDDRAVPLLGYLPQDLIGTSVLSYLHPEDRTLMLALHRKILKYAGQPPFEHSPIRFRCQNGDYVTLDTSWSSFVNPWSRKVAFVIGRHKVRTGPLNEEVFAIQDKAEDLADHDEIKELQAQIYRLFLQPVHNNGSSGYGSMGSNGSHEPNISMASSSESNGNAWEDTHREPVTLQQICADINKVKSWGQQVYLDSRRKLHPMGRIISEGPGAPPPPTSQPMESRVSHAPSHKDSRKQPHIPSYQQINCVDSIMRYLESYKVPPLKRKSESLSIATSSSSSEEDKMPNPAVSSSLRPEEVTMLDAPAGDASAVMAASTAGAVVGAPLTDLSLSTKALSVMSVTSQCSYSSTIVHVPQPESEVTALEDAPMGSEPADPTPPPPRAQASSAVASEELRLVGLTKEVLAAHTQKEEQDYVDRFQHRILQSPYSCYLQQDDSSHAHSQHRGNYAVRPEGGGVTRRGRNRGPKAKRHRMNQSSDSYVSPPERPNVAPVPPLCQTWPRPESTQPRPLLYPFQPPGFTAAGPQWRGSVPSAPMTSLHPGVPPSSMPCGLPLDPGMHGVQTGQVPGAPPPQGAGSYMTPIMAVILPNVPTYPGFPMYSQGVTPLAPAPPLLPQPFNPSSFGPTSFPMTQPLQSAPQAPPSPPPPSSPRPPSVDEDSPQPTHLFSSSRSSSPLQLNLLQEELPKPADSQGGAGREEGLLEPRTKGEGAPNDPNHDTQSTSSELLDLLLQEDARSGTGSNASGSGSGESGGSLGSGSNGSGSNGTSTSHTGSSNSSKYFASNDSSHTSQQVGGEQGDQVAQAAQDRANFEQCVENSLWSLIQNTPEPVMMTYQISPRDQAEVLKEDREKLMLLEPLQPVFTEEQKKELAEVHPWIQQHSLPQEIDTQGCVSCNQAANSPHALRPDASCPLDCPPLDPSPDT
ncbi:period circadian protein homolog 3-like isoform X1 [Megalops cyprinoides]|uniref:period circadian protein homolog 3-like isoform X1 n=1 Tax=Megalops cyprinoides TaxID=118141 RepID=UPI0018644967|nr:period circadian protein homolog 3-like isoform X1 [Megalops cyprinoides]